MCLCVCLSLSLSVSLCISKSLFLPVCLFLFLCLYVSLLLFCQRKTKIKSNAFQEPTKMNISNTRKTVSQPASTADKLKPTMEGDHCFYLSEKVE